MRSDLPDAETYVGYKGMERLFAAFRDALDDTWYEPLEFIDVGDQVVVPLRWGGRGKGSDSGASRRRGLVPPVGFLIIGIASLLTDGVLAVATFSGSSDCVDECHGYALPLVASLGVPSASWARRTSLRMSETRRFTTAESFRS